MSIRYLLGNYYRTLDAADTAMSRALHESSGAHLYHSIPGRNNLRCRYEMQSQQYQIEHKNSDTFRYAPREDFDANSRELLN